MKNKWGPWHNEQLQIAKKESERLQNENDDLRAKIQDLENVRDELREEIRLAKAAVEDIVKFELDLLK